jgi:putative NIF3 family GTP cyclohydrolase 1 type 2
MRRSIAQKFIKHFISLGVDAYIIADIMLYTLEIAQTLSAEREIKQEAFYKSMLSSFQQSISFMIEKGILDDFKNRVVAIQEETNSQNWFNKYEFNTTVERFDY